MQWSSRDQQHVWHPYTQMKTAGPPLAVVRGEGARLHLEDGRSLIDAISSWWVTVHGHSHPRIAEAIAAQARTLEQVIFAGFTHPQAVRLAERLAALLPGGLSRIFYSDNGSTAVEVALKMAWQYWHNQGQARHRILALEDAYHGDTFGAMSASARSVFTRAFGPLLFEVHHLPSPADDPDATLDALRKALALGDCAALILEPLVQGAGGMRMYSPATLDALTTTAQEAGVPVIFDEVMTGFHRTGRMFAMQHGRSTPDIVCLSKGLSGGFLPLAVTASTERIHDAFLHDDRAKMLFHGHSFTANALGCAAANASLDLFAEPETQADIQRLCDTLEGMAQRLKASGKVQRVRQQGCILAFDLPASTGGYLDPAGARLRDAMLHAGVLMRPLGEVAYVMPPYCITQGELQTIEDALMDFLNG